MHKGIEILFFINGRHKMAGKKRFWFACALYLMRYAKICAAALIHNLANKSESTIGVLSRKKLTNYSQMRGE